jgi:hypothetical protein
VESRPCSDKLAGVAAVGDWHPDLWVTIGTIGPVLFTAHGLVLIEEGRAAPPPRKSWNFVLAVLRGLAAVYGLYLTASATLDALQSLAANADKGWGSPQIDARQIATSVLLLFLELAAGFIKISSSARRRAKAQAALPVAVSPKANRAQAVIGHPSRSRSDYVPRRLRERRRLGA